MPAIYHNVRDKFGRFAPGKKKRASKPKAKKNEKKSIVSFYLIDDTGSMASKVTATIQGFNKILEDSREADKKNNIESKEILAKFGERGYLRLLDQVDKLTNTNYKPNRSATALYWAVIEAINHLEKTVKPKDKVVLTIFTDGLDNDSHWLLSSCKALVEQKNAAGWVVTFVGAGNKVLVKEVAKKMGIFASNTANYANTSAGVKSVSAKMSAARSHYSAAVMDSVDTNVGFFQE